jgi:hypothetical protein
MTLRQLLLALRRFVVGIPSQSGPFAADLPETVTPAKGVNENGTAENGAAGTETAKIQKRGAALAQTDERRPSMNAAYEKLIQHLDEHKIRYLTDSDDQSVCADFRGETGTYRMIAQVDGNDGLFQVFGQSNVRVPPGSRPAIAEAVARANYGLKVGKFEFDADEGDLRFHAAHLLTFDSLEGETIQRLMGTTIAMLNLYLPAFLSVIYGNETPKDAIRHVEPPRRAPDADTEPDADESK